MIGHRAILAALALLLAGPLAARAQDAPARDSATTARAPLDLNTASREALRALPVPGSVADALWEHRTYRDWFQSLYDLMEVEGMTPELLARLRPLVHVSPVFQSVRIEQEDEERRAGELNTLVQRLLGEEGASEGLVDGYIDQIKDPRDVNDLGYQDLVGYQNVSPVDAAAIVRERLAAGRIENASQLRGVPGLSYWGFRNLRDFVRYGDRAAGWGRPRLDYQFRLYDTPYLLDDADILEENIFGDTRGLTVEQRAAFRDFERNTYAGRIGLDSGPPALTHKLRARWGPYARVALVTHRNLGEERWDETRKGFVELRGLPARRTLLGPLRLESLVLGSFAVAFGEGLVMENTDFFMPRRTGYGYSVRPPGVRGDASRSDEFALRGVAADATLGPLRATVFASRDFKDAILNPDGSFNSYFRMTPRLSNDLLAEIRDDIEAGVFAGRGDTSAFFPMRDVMDERVLGGRFGVEPAPGVALGLSGVEIRTRNRAFDGALADRWNPRPTTFVIDPGRLEERDVEIGAGYDSRHLGDYRRVWGADARATWRNVAGAVEYAKLETSAEPGALERITSAGPEAVVGHAYVQYESFNALALYRDYDLGFDHPYARAFSEDARFEQTILDGNAFRLRNPYWAQLARTTPQPKAERGFYVTGRYQLARELLLSGFEFDVWTRKADGADLQRFAVRAEYRPIFPLRLRLRHAVSSRHADRPDDVRAYTSWDSRFELLGNLSNYDQLRFLYSTSNVKFAARGRLSGPASGGDTQGDTTAARGDPGHAVQAALTHRFTPDLSVTLSAEVYDGFLYNYEDNEFVVVDGTALRTWFQVGSRLSPQMSWRFKWTRDHQRPRTYVDIRDFGSLLPPTPDGVNARGDRTAFRLQLDVSL
jgi:DNA uptake protein ComE-like DNA-binding protein